MSQVRWVNVGAVAVVVMVWVVQCSVGLTLTRCPWVDVFLHANWAHLALNCWALYWLWRRPRWLIVPAYLIGCLGLWLDGGAMGLSAVLYALMGLQWRLYDCMRNRLAVAVSLLVAAFVPQLAFVAHFVPFCVALAVCLFARLVFNFCQDVGRG